jgi:hypothetical protein
VPTKDNKNKMRNKHSLKNQRPLKRSREASERVQEFKNQLKRISQSTARLLEKKMLKRKLNLPNQEHKSELLSVVLPTTQNGME